MIGVVGLGLGTIFITYPVLQTILKYAGVGVSDLSRRSDRDVRAGQSLINDNRRGPMTFWGAAMFQWINAKGWVMVIGNHHRLRRHRQLSLEYHDPGHAQPGAGSRVCSAWALFGSGASAVADVAPAGANVQHRPWPVLLLASLYPVFMDA